MAKFHFELAEHEAASARASKVKADLEPEQIFMIYQLYSCPSLVVLIQGLKLILIRKVWLTL